MTLLLLLMGTFLLIVLQIMFRTIVPEYENKFLFENWLLKLMVFSL